MRDYFSSRHRLAALAARWRVPRGHRREPGAAAAGLERVLVEGFVDRRAGARLAEVVRQSRRGVLMDLSEISGFDSAGLGLLISARERAGSGQVGLVGLESATARLLGMEPEVPIERSPVISRLKLRRLGGVGVVSVVGEAEGGALAAAVRAAASAPAAEGPAAPAPGTVVVDLLAADPLGPAAIGVLAGCASELAAAGQRLLFANAAPVTARALAREIPQASVHARDAGPAPRESADQRTGKLPGDATGRKASD